MQFRVVYYLTTAFCSALRQNLDCLLVHTPPCVYNRSTAYDTRSGSYETQRNNPGDFIRRGKQTIERYCEQGGGGWKTASCFTRQDVRDCESRHGFSMNPPPVNPSACRSYQEFRNCVVRIVRGQCYSQDLQLMATYLIDKAQDLSWSCIVDSSTAGYGPSSRMDPYNPNDPYRGGSNYNPNDPYRPSGSSGYNPSGYDSRYGSGSQYDRDRTTYDRQPYDPNRPNGQYGSQYGGQYGSQYGNQYDNRGTYDRDRYGSSGAYYGSGSQTGYTGSQYGSQPYGSQYGSNQPIEDRFGSGGYLPTTDSCLERSGYFVRSCEDTLIQRQRDAREGRSSNDVQRRICCALFFYRDCISRVVVDRCRDPSPVVVDILMGSRKRDLTVTCREYSRDQCSASSLTKSSFISLFLSVLIPIVFFRANRV